MEFDTLANIIAMVASLVGVVMLAKVSAKVGGVVGSCLKLVVVGIFFSIFIHAGVELMAAYELMDEEVLLPIMGVLLSVGSLIIAYAGYKASKAFVG